MRALQGSCGQRGGRFELLLVPCFVLDLLSNILRLWSKGWEANFELQESCASILHVAQKPVTDTPLRECEKIDRCFQRWTWAVIGLRRGGLSSFWRTLKSKQERSLPHWVWTWDTTVGKIRVRVHLQNVYEKGSNLAHALIATIVCGGRSCFWHLDHSVIPHLFCTGGLLHSGRGGLGCL